MEVWKPRFKPHSRRQPFDKALCGIARCQKESEIIDGTKKFLKVDLPLCGRHLMMRFPEPVWAPAKKGASV